MARILVIDDSELVRESLRMILEEAGHAIVDAEDGAAGLALASKTRFDLVITDLMMPRIDGIEFIVKLRGTRRQPRILAITGDGRFARDHLLRMATELGADMALSKPFGKQALLDAVDACLSPRSGHTARA